MRLKNQSIAQRRSGLAILGASILVLLAAGCDNSVEVGSPSFTLPTAPGPVITPSGATVTETRPIQGVSGISLNGVGHVRVQHAGAESLTLTAPENIMPLLTSEVVGGQLILDWTMDYSYSGQASDISFEVGVRQLDEVMLPGVGEIDVTGVNAARFSVDLSGVGAIRAAGSADRQVVRLSGVGDYDAPSLESRVTVITMTGTGSAMIRASERIEGYVAYPCTLEYWGDPVVEVGGNGTVRRMGP